MAFHSDRQSTELLRDLHDHEHDISSRLTGLGELVGRIY